MDGVESSPDTKVKEVPPIPIKTYKWEDVKRARRRGGYPWTYLYKDPFEDLQEVEFDMESIKTTTSTQSSIRIPLHSEESMDNESLDLRSKVEKEADMMISAEIDAPKDQSNELLPDSPDSANVSISQYLDNEPKPEEINESITVEAGSSKRAKSEEPRRKRKHSIESSYSRVSKYSLSKIGFMKRLKEAKDKIKLPKFSLSRSDSKLSKKVKKEDVAKEKKDEIKVSRKKEEPLYIHIPLKPPPGETDEFSHFEFEEAGDGGKRPSPIKEEEKVEEGASEKPKGVQLIILTGPSEDEVLATPIPETPTGTEVKCLDEKKMDELKTIARDVVDKYTPESKRKVLKKGAAVIEDVEDAETKVVSEIKETERKDDDKVVKNENEDKTLKTKDEDAKTKVKKVKKLKGKAAEEKKVEEDVKVDEIKKPGEEEIIVVKSKGAEIVDVKLKEEVKPEEEKKIHEKPEEEGQSKDEVKATEEETPIVKKVKKLKLIVDSVEDKKPEVESSEKPKLKKKKVVKKEKSKEEKLIEAQKTDDDKLEEQKVKMVVDEEDGLKTEAVIAQIITEEVHDQEKQEIKSSIKTDSPLLKKKVSFKRRSKDESDGVYEEVQVTTEVVGDEKKPLEQTQSMSVDEEKTYLDEKLIKATSLEEDYNKWSKANDHEYEPVNPPPDNVDFTSTSTTPDEKKPPTPVTDSDIEYLAAKAADFELLSKGITTTQPGGDAVFIPLASVLKEAETEEKDVPEGHGKKIHDAIKNSANKLQRQASILSDKASKEAGKIHTRVKSIKRPKISMPAKPKFEKPHMPKFTKPKMPTMPKMSKPKMPTMPKMSKPTMPKMPKMPKMEKPKMPERMKNISMPSFTLPKRGTANRQRRPQSSTTESTLGDSRKKIFDFATYPRMFRRKKKEPDAECNTPRTGTDISPTSEPSTFRPSFLFGNRWKKGKFTETPAADVAQDSLMSKASERSDAQGSVRIPLHSENSMDKESLDLRTKVEKEADMMAASGSQYDEDAEYMKENQEIHRASSLNAKLNDRWSHGVFRENTDANFEPETITTDPSSLRQQIEHNIHASSYDNIPRPGVVEEINEDEFIIRQKGISRDNIQVREILTSEIKKSFGKSPDDEPYHAQDLGNSDPSLPEVPKRRGLKKPKHKKTPHVSQEAISYELAYQAEPQEVENIRSEDQNPEMDVEDVRSYQKPEDSRLYRKPEIDVEDTRSYQEPERPRRRSRKDHSLDSEGGRSYEHEEIIAKPMRRSRKDYSLDYQDYEQGISGDASPSSQMVSDENIIRPKRKSRKQYSSDSQEYEGGPSYEISGNATPLSYEISDENILSSHDYLDYKMYENERMEGKEQPGIVVSDPYQESLFHPNFDDVPLAPPRRHRSLKSLNISEQDSITAELNGYKEISDQNLDFNLPHEYQIPTPDEPPRRPVRTRSRTRSHSQYDDDTVSKRTESLASLEIDPSAPMNLEYIGYSVIDKSRREPKAPRRKRSIKSNLSEERFHTMPRPLNDVPQPVRPLRNYSTLGPSRPPRKHSVPNLTDEEKENVSPYIEIEDDQAKNLQSGEVIQKMKDRPLPAPPRPPRKTRDSSRTSSRGDISQERNIMTSPDYPISEFDEAEVSVQTEPLPEGFECEELVQEKDDRVITPSKHKKPITEFEHQETITHGTLLVQPYTRDQVIEDTPIQTFEKSTERIVTVRREVDEEDETSEIPEDFKKLKDPPVSQPQVIERIIERHIPMQMDSTVEMELIKTHKLQVTDLDVDRLAVNELHANKIKVSEIDSSSISTGEINSNSGNLVVSGIELPASFFQQLVEKLQEQAEQVLPRMQTQQQGMLTEEDLPRMQAEPIVTRLQEQETQPRMQETQSSQTDAVEETFAAKQEIEKFQVTLVEEPSPKPETSAVRDERVKFLVEDQADVIEEETVTAGEVSSSKQHEEELEIDPELKIVQEYEDIASQLRLEEEKFEETLKKVEEIMQKSEMGEATEPDSQIADMKESIATEIDELIQAAEAEVALTSQVQESEDKSGKKKTPIEERLVCLESVETEIELVLDPPLRPPRSKTAAPETDLTQPETSDLELHLQMADEPVETKPPLQKVERREESEETPPPRPPRPVADPDYVPSQPPASFYALRSPPAFKDFDIDDDIPMIPRRRRHHKAPVQSLSSSDEVLIASRRRQRTPEPSIPQLTGQLTRACVNAADRSLKRLIQHVTNKVLGNADGKQDVNVVVVILLVLIACLILLGWDNKPVHHHHWEYFNPPKDL